MAEESTPMMRQYLRIKSEIPEGAILMFRLGDFYEMFGEDAITASPVLGATLTKRGNVPMCGVPYHALDAYLAKLIRAGMTAALCDQVEDPKKAKGLVRREVTRIVTPGTVMEDGLLDECANNYIAAISGNGLALMDVSTGEFSVEEFASARELDGAVRRYRPAEILRPDDSNAWTFQTDAAAEELKRHFGVVSLDGFGIEGKPDAVSAAGALLYYVKVTLRHSVRHVKTLRQRDSSSTLVMDQATIRHLAILPGEGVSRDASLFGVLNATKTPMGARRLAAWLRAPCGTAADANARLEAVAHFTGNRTELSRLQEILSSVRDLERLVAKIDSGRANARDVKALGASLRPMRDILGSFTGGCAVLDGIRSRIVPEDGLVELVDSAIAENPSVLLTEGNLIAPGYSAELDGLRDAASSGHRWIAEYQAKEIERTGIKTLKIRRNSVFGFYIEIAKSQVHLAPPEYVRRQTVTGGERFTTPELSEQERNVAGAQEKSFALEQELFAGIVAKIAERTAVVQETAAAAGELDAIVSFADRALAAGYVRPEIDDSDAIEIEDGRHPVIEQLPDAEPFVPNSTRLNCTTDQIMLITGPNMAGKSTYIRQVATIAAMAQAGSFVPAAKARIGAVDRIFTRIGAGDDFSRGRSTFLVEMQETAAILNNATPRSLIVLDEIGRGTSTFDGISIAWSVAEYLHENPQVKAKTLFATHYHELADLADRFKGVKNWTVRVKQDGDRIVFLRRIAPGVAEKSFGIHVAAMAGLPEAVTSRATAILANLEESDMDVDGRKSVRRTRRKLSDIPGQMTFF